MLLLRLRDENTVTSVLDTLAVPSGPSPWASQLPHYEAAPWGGPRE